MRCKSSNAYRISQTTQVKVKGFGARMADAAIPRRSPDYDGSFLAVRLIFCWVEVTVRAHMRRGSNKDTDNNTGGSDGNAHVSGNESAPRRAKSRRSPTPVLYQRIVRSQDARNDFQYIAGGLFAVPTVLFVTYAANIYWKEIKVEN